MLVRETGRILLAAAVWMIALFGSAEGQEWRRVHTGNGTSVAVMPDDAVVAVIDGIAYRSTDGGETWIAGGAGPANATALRVKDDNTIYAGSLFGGDGLTFSTDGGLSWRAYPNIPAWDVAFTSDGDIFAATEGTAVVRSTDAGAHWTVQQSEEMGIYIWSIAADREDNVYAGTQGEGVFRSTDNGETWQPLIEEAPALVDGVVVADDGTIYISGATGMSVIGGPDPLVGLFRSTDGGESWMDVSPFDSAQTGKNVLIAPSGDVYIAVSGSSNSAVFTSTNRGEDWRELSGEVDWGYVGGIALGGDGRLYAATAQGIYVLESVSSVPPEASSAAQLTVLTGPDGRTSCISIGGESGSGARLQIVDVRGYVVKSLLLDGNLSGEHRINISDAGLPPGLYICRLIDRFRTSKAKFIVQ